MQTDDKALMTRKQATTHSQADFVTEALSRTAWIRATARFYAYLMDEEVTPLQATYYLYAQLLTLGILLPYAMGEGWRVAMLMALAWTVSKCRARKPQGNDNRKAKGLTP